MARRAKSRKRRKIRRERQVQIYRTYIGIAVAVIAALILIYCLIANGYKQKFLRNTYINDLNVSGKTAQETEEILKDSVEQYELTLKFKDDVTETLTSQDLGLTYISSGEAETLLEKQKRFSWLSHLFGKTETYEVETSYSFDTSKVESAISALPEFQTDNITPSVDAHIELNDDLEYAIVSEVYGNEPNRDVVFEIAEQKIQHGNAVFDLTDTEDAYLEPSVLSDDEQLKENVEALNTFIDNTITISLDDRNKSRYKETISKETLITWVSEDVDGNYYIDSGDVATKAWSLVQRLANKYNYSDDTVAFQSTLLGEKNLPCDPYGFQIDVDEVATQLTQDAVSVKSEDIVIENAINDEGDPTFGGTYIEVDVTHQHVWFYKDGELFLETDCVTGLESDPERMTPSGVFYIYGKDEDKTLEGRLTADGPVTYSSHVAVWMPYYESYGIHDAPWRDEFGGDIYLESGSHGCVNLPEEVAITVYNNAPVGTTVIVLRESD